jgi:hypothetical protein
MATRMAKPAKFVQNGEALGCSSLNEEIEKQQNRAQKKQKESGVYPPAREPAE